MARYKRITRRKSIKGPDEFVSFWAKAIIWFQGNKDKLILPVLGVLIAVVLAVGFLYYYQQREMAASKELSLIMDIFPRADSGFKADSEQVVKSLDELSTRFPGAKTARAGKLYLAHALLLKNDFKEARKSYRGVMDSGNADDTLSKLACIGLATVMQEEKAYGEAVETLETCRNENANAFVEIMDLMVAQNHELNKNTAKALDEYRRFEEKYPASIHAGEVKEKISRLK